MTNNLKKISQELRAFAKRTKDFKYTESALIMFLMTGMLFASANIFADNEDSGIKNQVNQINTSINQIRTDFKRARKENSKLMKNTTLELTQLMEQGDHVVKSPWSSWQYGINYFNNNWNGTYKGRGDKEEKYPYEGIFERSTNAYERYVSPESKNYSLLGRNRNPRLASSNNRQGLSGYGIASTLPVNEPIVAFEVSAGINPRVFTAPTVTPLSATQPNLPQAINFRPVTPLLVPPTVDAITIPTITVPGTGNGDDMYIKNGSNNDALAGVLSNEEVGMIAQYSTSGGTMNVNVNNGSTMDISTSGVTFTGHQGPTHNGGSTYSTDLNTTGYSGYSAMKLVGGHEVKIDNTTINFKGTGTNYQRWLFHTDGHNDHGNSTWNIGSGSNINIDGSKLVMYTSQYHGGGNTTVGMTNSGNITTSATGSDNYIWMTLEAGAWPATRVMAFENKGTIKLNGTNDTLVLLGAEYANTGGFTFINDGTLQLKGANNKGILVKAGHNYLSSEILLNKPMEISGNNSVGIGFLGYADLEGGKPYNDGKSANNAVIPLLTTSRESVLNVDLKNNEKSTALYFNNNGTNIFNANNFNLTSTDGTKNTLVYVEDGIVNLNGTTNGKMNITGGKSNVGIYTKATDPLTNKGEITISNSDSSVGIYAKSSGAVTNTGVVKATGNSVKAIVADNSTITNSGKVNVTGTASSATDGAVGLAAMNNGTITHTGGGTIAVDGSASIGALGQSGGTVDITGGTIKATGGAFNTYAQGGTVKFNGTTIDTQQKSLAFYADNNGGTGRINFTGATTANIAGGTDANTRGTAFYYQGSGYSPFTSSDIASWSANTFGGTIGQLTLNMASGSRLFIASDVSMNLSDTAGSGLASSLGANIVGSDYKTFMLYKSLLKLNQSIDLDNANDAYNQLEISNSSIDNNNNNTITGTQAGQTAIAQENLTANRTAVTLNNNGAINLSGANSTGMYAKFGVINNNATGTITLGDTSTGLYGIGDSILTNTGTITIGSKSTAMYSEGSTTQGVTNAGTITSTGTASVGVLFKPAATITAGAVLGNTGNISLGDNSVGLYGENTATNYTTSNSGNITVGQNGIGMFGYATDVTGGTVTVGNKGVGVYSQGGNVNLTGGTIATGASEAVGVYTVGSGQTITNSGTAFNLGDTSVALANAGNGNTVNSTVANVELGTNNIYVYSSDAAGTVNNSTNLSATGSGNYGIYSAGTVTNSGNMDFGNGVGNVGIYSVGGGTATNTGAITIGGSNAATNAFGIGMAAGYQNSDTGNVINNGTINVNGDYSIGMYASGAGSTATNNSNIVLNGNNTTGIYADNGATAINTGNISTGSGSYSNVVGVYLGTGATLNNTGTITINGSNSVGVYLKGGRVVNYGNITVNGNNNPSNTVQKFTTPPTGKGIGGANIDAPAGAQTATVTINGVKQTPVVINTFAKNPIEVSASSIGMYVNTSGKDYTKSINGLGNLTQEADLIIGTEATEMTNSKSILIKDPRILGPYNNAIKTSGVSNWNIYSGGLNWLATPTLNPNDGTMTSIYMVKIPYTAWAGRESTPVNSVDTYNFLDGLEQRYGVEALDTRERKLFQKLNGIGNNEAILFYQATDEMMGHQYGNLQQRINTTGNLLDKEFRYLKHDWRNPSKQNNKIKVFGMRDEYNTDTAGIIDYTSNAYGVAYVHEDEKIKMGNSSGWYAGAVTNRFKFKDIGHSRENQTQLKAGIFKTMSPKTDHNGALQWTIGGDVFFGINNMKRKYLVVDDIFQAKSDYNSYGAALKTDLGYDIRMSERTHLRPYGALKMEYGRFNDIKEDRGEMRLEVKGNDYFSVKPEVGMEFRYVQPLAVRTNLTVGLSAAYENELGKMASKNNEGRVRYTSADWFGIRGEKEDRRGNGKFDLNIGVDNTRFGVTVNGGYDTKGNNVRGGIGFRAIY
ncbi:autotransporter-associated N-terminal domain-containing protein [Leptotrichia trevisanii]|uniref:Autotransporter beta-domain protein n=1 Tax=Leptotrichia trevisanii TaxID=109328 RepID=A0A510JZQ1_9FUSO|nr:autotransporter-associated N-terminal domain-containing protein [Leptotrichia trevisanii]BBM44850.1 autotransporter beta-domain protein [Leptotrichia trevisanii]